MESPPPPPPEEEEEEEAAECASGPGGWEKSTFSTSFSEANWEERKALLLLRESQSYLYFCKFLIRGTIVFFFFEFT